jgi:hypothetical protein
MLSDVVEAIAKTLKEPTPNRFRDMVRGVIMKRLEDGQFDLCNLTIADFRKIEDSFVRTLTNMYHNRIRYSEADGVEANDVATTATVKSERPEKPPRTGKAARPKKSARSGEAEKSPEPKKNAEEPVKGANLR